MSDIGKYLEIKELAEKAGLDLAYEQGGILRLTDKVTPSRSCLEPAWGDRAEVKTVMASKCVQTVYGAVRGYIFAKEND